jgi:HK97 family phage prohead protease
VPLSRERKSFALDLTTAAEDGTFTGLASVYGVKDLQGDIVEKGAFRKTLSERGATVPILWQHDPNTPVGLGKLTDSPQGLVIEGKLSLGTTKGRDVYELLKDKVVTGLSIGFDTVKQKVENGARKLLEIKLYEVSAVVWPANEDALVSSVKSDDEPQPPSIDITSLELEPTHTHFDICVGEKTYTYPLTWTDNVPLVGERTVVIETKAGARHSRADQDKLQAVHDHSVALGAKCMEAAEPKSAVVVDETKSQPPATSDTPEAGTAAADPELIQSLRARNDIWRHAAAGAQHGNAGHQDPHS